MVIDPASAPPRDVYRMMVSLITPRPIAWVSTLSPQGISNLAPFSFFNGIGANPPTLLFCPVNNRHGQKKDTLRNVETTPEFVVNVVPYALAKPMNDTSEELPYEVSEFEKVGIATEASTRVKPPRVKDSPIHLECVVHQILNLGTGPLGANVVIGRILLIHVADSVLGPDGQIDPLKLDTIGRMGGSTYTRTTTLFDLTRPGA